MAKLPYWLLQLLDPKRAELRPPPKSEEAMMIAAHNAYVLAYDNLSSMPSLLSDALCRLARGAGDTKRTHYEMTEETSYSAARPIVFNSIEEIATRGDLLSHHIIAKLSPIAKSEYKTERQLKAAFEKMRPKLLGALYDAVSMALRNQDGIQLSELTQLADFQVWVTAAEPTIALRAGDFTRTLQENEIEAVSIVLDEIVPKTLLRFMIRRNQEPYNGYIGQLYTELSEMLSERE